MAAPVKPPNAALIIRRAIMNALRESEPIVRNHAIASLDRVLRRVSGRLASSIYARTRQTRGGGRLTIGTPVHYGRFWEFGFLRGGKLNRRRWLRPAADEAMPEVVRRVEMHLARAMNELSGTVTIDVKIT
jgi:hypothetical protein